ncbi:MAG: hypothetical protein BGO69_01635 [Bacteroidetes bacterium 46-16]|jgi:hypothetical protein|nr:MAG: hypothetical protein BGO69_01635 [Bacteroidetes bacterium 46-16]
MNTTVEQPVAVACLFTWIGFVCAISFMEAWLKFRAPGVTLPIGLGIGRLVFAALNKVEWAFAIVVSISVLMHSKFIFIMPNVLLLFIILILILQTVWLLPALDARAELYIQDKPVTTSHLHIWFVVAELIKVTGLFIIAISFFKQS